MIKAVIFDIDDTLTTKNSWSQIIVRLGGTLEEDQENYLAYKAGKITQEVADKRIFYLWTRNGPVSRKRFLEIFNLIPLREGSLDLINYLKSKHIIPCLITGSLDLYAKTIAEKFNIEDYYYNADLIFDQHDNISKFIYRSNQAEIKLNQLYQFCEKNNLKPDECAVVGDSENDHLLFLETKNGIAVRTPVEDKTLESIAWKVVNNLSEIKSLI